MNLYEVASEIRLINDDCLDGELSDEDLKLIDRLSVSMDGKIDTHCKLIREEEADIEAIKKEIGRLTDKKKQHERNLRRRKEWVILGLKTAGAKRYTTALFDARYQSSPPSATCVVDPHMLPLEYKRVKVEADAAAALEFYRANGEAPPGFEIQADSVHLVIK